MFLQPQHLGVGQRWPSFNLVEYSKDHTEVKAMCSYKVLERILKEQCNVSGDDKLIGINRPKEIPSDSLQNPSDADETYSGHKGQGYRWRSEAEASISEYDKRTGIKHLRV